MAVSQSSGSAPVSAAAGRDRLFDLRSVYRVWINFKTFAFHSSVHATGNVSFLERFLDRILLFYSVQLHVEKPHLQSPKHLEKETRSRQGTQKKEA